MKEIKIIIEESIDKDGDIFYTAYLELFPYIKAEGYDLDDVRMYLEKDVTREIGFKAILLDSFLDYIPEDFEIECRVYSKEELSDNDLFRFTIYH